MLAKFLISNENLGVIKVVVMKLETTLQPSSNNSTKEESCCTKVYMTISS
jgi:hypothetical protein